MSNRTIAGDLARQMLQRFPETPTKTLARKLRSEHPEVYKSIEHARTVLRSHRGAMGDSLRKSMKPVAEAVRTPEQSEMARSNPFGIPDSDSQAYLPYRIPSGINEILVLPDIHIPFHCVASISAALKYAKDRKPDAVILNGDFLDSYQLSRFCRNPKQRSFSSELAMGRKIVDIIRNELNPQLLVYKLGNHEDRYHNYMQSQAATLFDVPQFSWDMVFKLDDGISLIGEKRIIWAGELPIIHGHEYTRGVFAPVNAARGYFIRAHGSVLVSHHHHSSEHSEPNIKGNMLTSFSTGCLCTLNPDYMPLNRWNNGFAWVSIDKEKYYVDNMRIFDGEIM